ncbi:MAG: PadR family transcriptional regulator [Anaerolineae bacterium]|nr:PadR family transcriptional regulator [Anaerolineae bacterium]
MLKYVLLGVLNYQPLTGYQLKQFMDQAAGHFWYAQTSQIYRTLDQLEKDGMLTSHLQAQDERPDRRLYQITPGGQADLRAWLAEPMTELQTSKDALLVRLYFSAQMDKATILTQLRVQRALHQRQLDLYRNDIPALIQQSAEEHPSLKRDAILWDATRRNGELMEEAYIRWLDETIERVEKEL